MATLVAGAACPAFAQQPAGEDGEESAGETSQNRALPGAPRIDLGNAVGVTEEALKEIELRDYSGQAPQGDPYDAGDPGDPGDPGGAGTEFDATAIDDPIADPTADPMADPMADPADDTTVEPDAGLVRDESPSEALQRYFDLYRQALQNENYLEADALAKRVVELSIEVFGINSLDSAKALTNLGIAQHHNEEYEAAQTNYNAAIDIIERTTDRLNENLINPLKGLGAAQLAAGRPDQAVESFERAVHVSHVNEGPHNLMQVEILQSLAETYLAAGEFETVENIQEHIFQLQARDVSLDSTDIIPALENQAMWQHRLQLYEKERYTWRKIIDLIEDHHGKDDLRLIPPLTGLGKSHLFVGSSEMSFHQPTSITSGEVYLKRALRIAEENPESTWQVREGALLALGDFYIMSGKPNRARNVYEEAWQLLSEDPERLQHRRDNLETLVVLQRISPPRYVGIDGEVRNALPGENYSVGTLVFDYGVNTRGFTTDIEMVEASPSGFADMESAVLRDLRAMIHRPRLEDGTTVPTDGLSYTHKFFYRESDLPAQTEPGDVAASSE